MNAWYCDGSTWKNGQPGQDSSFLVLCPDGEILRRHLGDVSINVAELTAIYTAADLADYGDMVCTDSMLCFNWLRKFRPTDKNRHVADLVSDTRLLLDVKVLHLHWLPREENLAGLCIEEEPFYAPFR